jgi:DNA (cytosine-5)-methyltransferase 1
MNSGKTTLKYLDSTKTAPLCVDLFAGAGGLTLGFTQAGGFPLAAVDHDKDSMETYQKMFPMTREVYCGDIEQWQPNIDLSAAHVFIGGPPCQGFSLARGQRFVDDPRNNLYKHFVRLVKRFQPAWIVMENVPGIINIGNGVILDQVYEDFNELGYCLDHRVINMANYGIPQSRKRAIFVGNKIGVTFQWAEITHQPRKTLEDQLFPIAKPYVSILDALGDLPWSLGKFFAHRANSQMRGPRNRNVAHDPAFTLRVRGDEFAFCENPATGAFIPQPLPNIPFIYRPSSTDFQNLMREPAPYWVVSSQILQIEDKPVLPLVGTRRLAVLEQARLQSFPDWFQFSGRIYSQSRQIGNAVPPLFAYQLFKSIFEQSDNAKQVQRTGSRKTKLSLKPLEVLPV